MGMSRTLQILVIGDEDTDYQLLTRHLRKHDLQFNASHAASDRELQDALRLGRWDLVLADYSLPDIDISERVHFIMERLPDTPIILVSGKIGEENAVDLLRAGVEDFVNKDNLARLIPAIHRARRDRSDRQARRETERALENSERRYKKLYEELSRSRWQQDLFSSASQDVIFLLDPEGRLLWWNPRLEKLSDIANNDMHGRLATDFIAESDRPATLDAIEDALRTGSAQLEARLHTEAGDIYYQFRGNRAEHEGITYIAGIGQDISERRSADEALRLNESRMRQSATVLENTAEGVFITDTHGNILDTNPAFSDITGYSKEEVLGENPRIWQSERHHADFYRDVWQTIEKTGQWRGEIWNRRKNGADFPEWLSINAVRDPDDRVTHYVAVFTDISAMKRSQEKLEHLAHYDALTGLPNRLLLQARLDHAIDQARRSESNLALIFIDLDRFKDTNDSFGHPAGDLLLKEVTRRLTGCMRSDDTVARLGGDEFVLLLEAIPRPDKAAVVAEKVQQAFADPVNTHGQSIHVSVSMGICTYPQDGVEAETLFRNADAAMYGAKEDGRGVYRFYTEDLTANAVERILLENHMRRALQRNEFHLVYQPQLNVKTHRVCGVEALLRWEHPEHHYIPPTKFIPMAEESGLIRPIGAWILHSACKQPQHWLEQGVEFGHIAINISGAQFQREGFLDTVRQVLSATGLPADRLELEVTENFIMNQIQQGLSELYQLRELGVTLAIDDFGTGYSSLSQLKSLPIDKLKIDQSFIRNVPVDYDDSAICGAVIAMGTNLKLAVIAEGVETSEQNQYLRDRGCDMAQGYFYSHPLSANNMTHWLRRQSAISSAEAFAPPIAPSVCLTNKNSIIIAGRNSSLKKHRSQEYRAPQSLLVAARRRAPRHRTQPNAAVTVPARENSASESPTYDVRIRKSLHRAHACHVAW